MSIHKRNGRWQVRWRENGAQRSRQFDRRRDAQAFEAERRRREQLGAHAPAEPSREPLRAWLDEWWDLEGPTWARSTRVQRGAVIDKWITPYIGDVSLRDLGEDRVMAWRAEILRAGCPAQQANDALTILSSALGSARRARRIPSNPCAGIRKLPVEVKRPRALTPLEVEKIRATRRTRAMPRWCPSSATPVFDQRRPYRSAGPTWAR